MKAGAKSVETKEYDGHKTTEQSVGTVTIEENKDNENQ